MAKTEKRPVGRPSEYKPEYCERVVEMGKEGYSKTQMAVSLGVVRQTLDYWSETYPEFSTALTYALEFAEGYWENVHATFAKIPDHRGNGTLLHLMKSRFRETYGEKQEIAHSGNVDGLVVEFLNDRHPAADES